MIAARAARRLAPVFVAAVIASAPHAASGQAVSTVVVSDAHVTVNVPIEVIGATEALIATWQRGIDAVWNAGNDGRAYRVCGRDVVFHAQFMPRDTGETLSSQRHIVVVEQVRPGQSHVSRVWHALGTSPAYSARTGFWGSNTDGAIAAHEFGHLLGLLDEYLQGDTRLRAPGERPVPDVARFPDAWRSVMAQEQGSVLQRHVREVLRIHGAEAALSCRQ